MSFAVGFLAGYCVYHFLMNRAVMMRRCCLDHFATHETCACIDCVLERKAEKA